MTADVKATKSPENTEARQVSMGAQRLNLPRAWLGEFSEP
jgi:hypothetical protein